MEKPIPVTFDLGNLATFDPNPVEKSQIEQKKEAYLTELSRDNVQLMINQILQLPIKSTTESSNGKSSRLTLIQLPTPESELPREKALPKPKPLTKWQQFAIKKGIQNKKSHDKKVFDEESGKWVNKWGYQGKNKQLDDQWLVEVDEKNTGTEKEFIDPRTLSRQERLKLVKKNQAQQKKNLRQRG